MNKIKLKSYLWTGLFIVFVFLNIPIFLDIFYMFKESFTNGWNNFLNVHVVIMQNTIFFFGLLCLFIKKIKVRYILFVLPFAVLENNSAFFSMHVHPFLISTHFYHLFSNNPTNVSPEYTRVLFCFIVMGIYIARLFWRRNFHTIFITLSMLGILGTAILFHTVTLAQINNFTYRQELSFKKLSYEKNQQLAQAKCDILNVECSFYQTTEDPFVLSQDNIVKKYAPYIQPHFNKASQFFFYQVTNDQHIANRLLSRKPIAYIKNGSFNLIVIDRENYTNYLQFNQVIFGILAFISHCVWLFGTLYLMHFHDKRIRQRVAIKQNSIANS